MTEAAPKEHHDRGMSGWVEGGGSSLGSKSGHRHRQCLVSIIIRGEYLMRSGRNTLAFVCRHIYVYIYIYLYAYTDGTNLAETCAQASTTCVLLGQFYTLSLWLKARHFRVRGRYVLVKVRRLDSYKKKQKTKEKEKINQNPLFQAFSKYNTCFLMARLYKSLQKTKLIDWIIALTCNMCLTDITAAGYA